MLSLKEIRFESALNLFLICCIVVCPFVLKADQRRGNDLEDLEFPHHKYEYENYAEERFQMECDYLGIKGGKKKKACKLFEASQQQRELVKENKSEGKLTVTRAIKKLNQIDIEYYEQLRPLVSGKKHKARIERILDKLRKRSDGQVSMQKCKK